MSNLTGGLGAVEFTVAITRAATGQTEHYKVTGTVGGEPPPAPDDSQAAIIYQPKEPEHGSHAQHVCP